MSVDPDPMKAFAYVHTQTHNDSLGGPSGPSQE